MDCSALSTNIPGEVFLRGSPQYAARKASYFSAFENELSPAYFIQPNSTTDFARVIKRTQSDTSISTFQLAIRSGGHTPLTDVTLDLKTNTVSVGVGNSWDSIYEVLGVKSLAIIGERVFTIGVGGLTLGGGLLFFSAEREFVCGNVDNFEVVLASGEMVQADTTSNPDIFSTLKGGFNNFGIVTEIDFPTFE